MKQALHILRKDIQHLRPELAAYAVLLLALGLVSPQTWDPAAEGNTYLQIFDTLLKVILPMCWLFLITRAVHDEPLVGDRQFWVTRPYRWTSLLAAKLLFLILCVAMPYLLTQAALLLYAGLNPFAALPGLLVTLLSFSIVVWLPLSIAAALTATVTQAFTALVVVMLAYAGILTFMLASVGPLMTPPNIFPVFGTMCAAVLAWTLIHQYSTRDTRGSRRTFVIGISICFLFFGVARVWNTSGPAGLLTRMAYPATNGPVRLEFDSTVNRVADKRSHSGLPNDLVPLTLPIHVMGMATQDRLFEPNVTFTLETLAGRYSSPWRPADITADGVGILVPQRVLQAAGTGRLAMHLSLVATRLYPGPTQTITATSHFRIPGGGSCVLYEVLSGNNMNCRYPFENETPTQITGTVVASNCDQPGKGRTTTAVLRTMSAGTRVDPVVQVPLRMGGTVCPGTPLTVIPYLQSNRLRLDLDASPVGLDSFRDE